MTAITRTQLSFSLLDFDLSTFSYFLICDSSDCTLYFGSFLFLRSSLNERSGFERYSESPCQENIGSLINIALSSTYLVKFSRFVSRCCCLLIISTSLFHLSIIPLGSFDVNMHSISGVSNSFHLWFVTTLLHLNRKLWNRLKTISSPNLIDCQFFTSFRYDASILCACPYTFSNRYCACLNPSFDGS